MLQAFIIMLREGFESFLIVAVILAYLRRSGYAALVPAVWWGVASSIAMSTGMGFLMLQGGNQPLWEGVFGLVAAFFVTWLVTHMWRTAPQLKSDMENRLSEVASRPAGGGAAWGVFLFTVFMITREGMETALLLIQVHEPRVVAGISLGALAAAVMALAWAKFGRLIDLKRFFQVTALFLLLFVGQILLYSFHEFSEAGVLPNSEALHLATEPFSPEGIYGRWIGLGMVLVCAVWLAFAWMRDRASRRR